MRRSNVRAEVLTYLEDFFSNFMLYKKFPTKHKKYSELWALSMYEELTDEQRIGIYLKQIKKTWKAE